MNAVVGQLGHVLYCCGLRLHRNGRPELGGRAGHELHRRRDLEAAHKLVRHLSPRPQAVAASRSVKSAESLVHGPVLAQSDPSGGARQLSGRHERR